MAKEDNKTILFYEGISDDPRIESLSQHQVSKHFDIFSNPRKITPYRDLEADTNDGSTATGMKQYFVKDFFFASESARLYGLGQTAGGLTKIVYKADATTGNWTLPSSAEGNGAVKNDCFFEFKDYAWGFQGTNQIFKYGLLSGSPTITNSASTVGSTITSVANGVIASDANAYMAYNNVIVRIAPGGTITDSAKTVPANYKITSLTNYGNYLAIGCSPIQPYNGKSKVFLWDLASDLFYDTVEWGAGDLRVLDNVDGVLVGVTDLYLNNSVGAGRGSLVIKIWQGGTPQVVKQIFTKALTNKQIPLSKAVKEGRLYFSAKIMTNDAGTTYNEGIWSFGRKNSSYSWALSIDYVVESANTSGIQAFGNAGNYFFATHSADGSISKTNDAASYTFTSIVESQVYGFGNVYKYKKLECVQVSTVPLTTGQSLTLKYRVDGATSWTTIGTMSTVGQMSHEFYGIESTGAPFVSAKEFEFRLESTGGAEITGFTPIPALLMSSNI